VVGLWVDSTGRCPNGQIPRSLLKVDLQKIEGLKQMLWAATLWEEVVLQEQLPKDHDNVRARSKELAEAQHLYRCRPDMASSPVMDIPGHCLKVRCMDILVVAYADAVRHLAEGHHLLRHIGGEGQASGRRREVDGLGCVVYMAVMCVGGEQSM
jgi:hypothetical protein